MHPAKDYKWIRIWGLSIAIAAMAAAGAMSGSCALDTKTTACEQFGLRCKEGEQCAAHQAVCIEIGGCGDGIVDRNKGEVCDDGNIVDGEMNDAGAVITVDQCSHDCKSTQECGNNITDINEGCDHGSNNGMPDDSCDEHCQLRDKICGNSQVEKDIGEECDPGDEDSENCNSAKANLIKPDLGCKAPKCGDGYFNKAAEFCDTGIDTSTCNAKSCTISTCGDHIQNQAAGEDCDDGSEDTVGCNGSHEGSSGFPNCRFPTCGDGHVNRMFTPIGAIEIEECDNLGGVNTARCNGNNNGHYGPGSCRSSICGDGYTNRSAGEECDNQGGGDTQNCNGNNDHTMGEPPEQINNNSNSKCRQPQCGDGYLNLSFRLPNSENFEKCDTGGDSKTCNGNNITMSGHTNNPDSKCQPARCGDRYINPAFLPSTAGSGQTGEECDDGDIDIGDEIINDDHKPDACRTNCRMAFCGDNVIDKHGPGTKDDEICDDGSDNSDTRPNACRTTCHPASCGDGIVDPGPGHDEACDPNASITGCDPNSGTPHCNDKCKCDNIKPM